MIEMAIVGLGSWGLCVPATPTWLARPRPARRIGTEASVVAPSRRGHEIRSLTDR